MPSLRTRIAYQNIVLDGAQAALVEAQAAVSAATETLTDLQSGTIDLDAITIGGQMFVNNAGVLEVAP